MQKTRIEFDLNKLIIRKFYPVFDDVMEHGHTHYTFKGGRSGTRSTAITIFIIFLMLSNKNYHAIVFRKTGESLENTVYNNFLKVLRMMDLEYLFKAKLAPLRLILKKTGQTINFRGVDDITKLKSISAPFGYIAITHFEELNEFTNRQEITDVLISTQRGALKESKQADDYKFWNFESYNPPENTANWVNQDVLQERKNRLVVESNYLDVPREWLGDNFFDEIENLRAISERVYRNRYLGEITGTGGTVFENVKVRAITDEEYKGFNDFYYGVDWGFYPDPWAFAKCAYNASKRILYILDEQIEYKKNNKDTAEILIGEKKLTRDDMIICDSAEPKSVGDYLSCGLYARGAEKGPDSIKYSMKWLQGLTAIIIDSKCKHAAKEFLEYEYEKAKDGSIITGYPDKNNHFIDATRYALNLLWRERGK